MDSTLIYDLFVHSLTSKGLQGPLIHYCTYFTWIYLSGKKCDFDPGHAEVFCGWPGISEQECTSYRSGYNNHDHTGCCYNTTLDTPVQCYYPQGTTGESFKAEH